MTIRLSTGLRNNMVGSTGLSASFLNGFIDIFFGTQPATADSAETGTKLGTVSLSSATPTNETQASATLTLSGSGGSVNTVTVGGFNLIPQGGVNFTTDLSTTAALLADAINAAGLFSATASAAVVTLKPPPGAGATYNATTLAATYTTMSGTGSSFTGGVAAAAGLKFGAPSAGSVSKSGVWSFNGLANNTAGWFRFKGSVADAGGVSTTLVRMDGSVAVSGADMNLSNISIISGSPTTIDSFTVTLPAA